MIWQYILGAVLVLSAIFMTTFFSSHLNDLQKLPDDAPKKQQLIKSALWTMGSLLVFLITVLYIAFTQFFK